jgi:cobaltochelatase CobN
MSYHLTFISISSSGLRYIDEVLDHISNIKDSVSLHNFFIGESKDQSEKYSKITDAILSSQLVFLDLMGADRGIVSKLEEIIERYKGDLVVLGSGTEYLRSRIKLGAFEFKTLMASMGKMKKRPARMRDMNIDKMLKMTNVMGKFSRSAKDFQHWLMMQKFWSFAGFENIKNMLLLILSEYGELTSIPRPGELIDYSEYVLFDPRTQTGYRTFDELKKEGKWERNTAVIGLLFSITNYPYYLFGIISQVMDMLEKDYNIVPIGVYSGNDKFKKINKLIDTGLKIDLLWDFLPFRFGAGPMGGKEEEGLQVFRRLNVPVMHPFFMSKRKIAEWKENTQAFGPAELIISIMLPELDGVIDTIPLAGLENKKSKTMPDLQELCIIPERFEKLKSKSRKYINLREKNNKDKKIAFILYNYPPGEGNVGGGAFLDTFKSMERICKVLKKEDYSVDGITAEYLEEVFMKRGCCNSSDWSGSDSDLIKYNNEKYLPCKNEVLHEDFLRKCAEEWGDPPGTLMAGQNKLFIPGIISGNISIGLQPSRGSYEDPSKNYHDKDLPPHHQYMAFYRWLKKEFQADAVVHVGTHGTLEFLPGKESGMCESCFPDYLINDLPHFYFYYTGNPSEAIIAKRRIHGCLVSYSGPPFIRSGAYGDSLELEEIIDEYQEAEFMAPQQKSSLMDKIKVKVSEMKLIVEDNENLDSISSELTRLKCSLMPLGLHEIGKPFSDKDISCFLSGILNWNRGDIRAINSIVEEYTKSDLSALKREDSVFETTEKIIEDYYFGSREFYRKVVKALGPENTKALDGVLSFGQKCLIKIKETEEVNGLLKGLSGQYIEAHLGGDVIRDPDVFPTGCNIFQFDARLVPSEVAAERGKEIAESTLEFYKKEHGKYPESVSLVLWGLETSRTKGETIGQILQYLGVRLVKSSNSFEKKYELVPLDKLGRPRIDCLVTICGFFRDMFPNLLSFLDEIFEAVSYTDEPEEKNYMRKHTLKQAKELEEEMDAGSARELAHARIFGPPEGQYGTGLTTMVENRAWKDEAEIAEGYLSAQKHVYTRERRGEAQRDLFESNLGKVDIVSQVRSSVDYSITDLDHYYEYFGGLAKSIETVKGAKPVMLFTDSSSSKIYTDEAKKAVEIGVRTRLLNPEYIDGLLKHKVHGVQHLAKRVENLIGLSATTGSVDSWIFSSVKETLLDNQEMYERLKKNNSFATHEIMERLLEANKRGYWDATEEELEELKIKYLEIEGDLEDISQPLSSPPQPE